VKCTTRLIWLIHDGRLISLPQAQPGLGIPSRWPARSMFWRHITPLFLGSGDCVVAWLKSPCLVELLSAVVRWSKDLGERGLVYFDGARYQWPTKVLVLGVPEWWRETQFNTGGSCLSQGLINMLSTSAWNWASLSQKKIALCFMLDWVSLPTLYKVL